MLNTDLRGNNKNLTIYNLIVLDGLIDHDRL